MTSFVLKNTVQLQLQLFHANNIRIQKSYTGRDDNPSICMLLSCGMWSSNSEGKTELKVEMILYEVKCQWNGPIKLGVMHCKKQD